MIISVAVSTTDSVNPPDINNRNVPSYSMPGQTPAMTINSSKKASGYSKPGTVAHSRSAPKTSMSKGNKSAPPSPMFQKRNSNSINRPASANRYIVNTDDEDEEKGPGYTSQTPSRWASHPHAHKMTSIPPGIDMTDVVPNHSNHSNNMRPPPPPGSVASQKKRSGNIAGFDDDTLGKIDDCNLEALMGTMHEGSECLKHFQKAMSTFATQVIPECNSPNISDILVTL